MQRVEKMNGLPAPLFVYGSLKRGFRHHRLLRRALRLHDAVAPGCRLVLLEAYPALVYGGAGVQGELYCVDRPLLAKLDVFEDCPELYRRQLIRLRHGQWAYAYLAASPRAGDCPRLGTTWRE